MKIIKSVGKLFKDLKTKILSLGTPQEEEVDYSKVVQREVPKESTEKLTVQAAIETIGTALENTLSIAEHEEGVESSSGTPTPHPKMAAKKEPVAKEPVAKEPVVKKAKKTTADTKKTAGTKTKAETNKKKETPKKVPAKTTSTKTKVKKSTVKNKPGTAKIETAAKPVSKKPAVKKSAAKTADKKTTVVKKKAATAVKTETGKKKASPEKTSSKKATSKNTEAKTEIKKSTEKKTSKKVATTKKAEKIALYAKDIKKHYGEVDSDFLEIIVKNLGPSIYKKDAELVSCSDPKELNTVRKNFLMKKLGIDASQKVLDAAIQDVCEELKETKTKYRATFYYSLAKKFKKESRLS